MNNDNEERMREYNIKIAYKNEIIEGIRLYVRWEEGKQYVGTQKDTRTSNTRN